jgi:hypothetical protein
MSSVNSIIMATSGPASQGVGYSIQVENSLRPQSTFGPKKYYTEMSYDFPNMNVQGLLFAPPPNPIATRVDVKNNNMSNY